MPEAVNGSSNKSTNLTIRFLTRLILNKAAQSLQYTQLKEREDE